MKIFKLAVFSTTALCLSALSTWSLAQTSPAGPFASAHAESPAHIESIEHVQEGGQATIRIRLSEALKELPRGFMVANPPRIALDFPKRFNFSGPKVQEFNSGLARSVGVMIAGEKTRLVLSLRENALYETRIEGNDLFVSLRAVAREAVKVNASSASSAAISSGVFAQGDPLVAHGLSGFDFRRGPAGEGRVLVDMSDANTGIDIKQQGQRLVVDFINATASAELNKNMNVSDFGTLVNTVSISAGPRGSRMIIEPRGDWEYSAYQADKRFVVEIKKRADKQASLISGGSASGNGNFSGEKMSMNFQNIDIRNLLNVIADFTKLNIITSDSVAGKLTVRLQDVPWDQALDVILNTRGLDMRRKDSVVWVAPREEIAGFEKKALEAQALSQELEPTRTESFLLNYSTAVDVASLLGNDKQRILSKRGSVVIDTRTNQLFVQDTPAKLLEVAGIIKKLDVSVRQVLIEARIVEARDTWGQSLGAKLGVFRTPALGDNPTIGFANVPGAAASTAGFTPQVNLPALGLGTGASPSSFALTLLNAAATQFLSLEISAAEADGRGKIVSSPRVITANQEKALIEQGTELPYQQASASGATNVAFKKANLKLEVTPQITPDGNVIMSVDINKDAPGANTSAGFAIDTKHIQTKVLIENGGTVVIGGIYTQDERTDVDKVPFLGDLPALGNLFRSTVKKDSKTELLIFLTPRILDDKVGLIK